MLGAAMALRNINDAFRAINNIDPKKFLETHHNHPIVQQVLGEDAALQAKVMEGLKEIETIRNGPPTYFDLSEKYGDLVTLLGCSPDWCCKNNVETGVIRYLLGRLIWWAMLLLLNSLPLLTLLAPVINPEAGTGIDADSGAIIIAMELIVFVASVCIYQLDSLNGRGRKARDMNIALRWAPDLWASMLEKAKEIDCVIARKKRIQNF